MGTKSDIVRCLEDTIKDHNDSDSTPVADVIILDGPAIVNMLRPGSAKTFADYAKDVFLPYVHSQLNQSQRVDIVWDDYREDTLKDQTREKRGSGVPRRVEPKNAIPRNLGDFLRHNDNNRELFSSQWRSC